MIELLCDCVRYDAVDSLPTLVLADQPDDFSIFAVRPDRQTVAKAIHDLLDPELEEVNHVAKPSTKKVGQPAVALVEPTVNDIVYMVDLEKAIFYSLGHEVILHKVSPVVLLGLKRAKPTRNAGLPLLVNFFIKCNPTLSHLFKMQLTVCSLQRGSLPEGITFSMNESKEQSTNQPNRIPVTTRANQSCSSNRSMILQTSP